MDTGTVTGIKGRSGDCGHIGVELSFSLYSPRPRCIHIFKASGSISHLSTLQAIKMKTGKGRRASRHRQSLVTLSRRHSLVKLLEGGDEGPPPLRRGLSLQEAPPPPRPPMQRRASLEDLEAQSCLLAPAVEGRIVPLVDPATRGRLEAERAAAAASSVIQEVEEIESPNHQSA